MDELIKAVADLKAALIKQYGALPTEISTEFSVIENLVNEASKAPEEKVESEVA